MKPLITLVLLLVCFGGICYMELGKPKKEYKAEIVIENDNYNHDTLHVKFTDWLIFRVPYLLDRDGDTLSNNCRRFRVITKEQVR